MYDTSDLRCHFGTYSVRIVYTVIIFHHVIFIIHAIHVIDVIDVINGIL